MRYTWAIHEGGHVLCFAAFRQARFRAFVARDLTPGALGRVTYTPPWWTDATRLAEWEAHFAVAGARAELALTGGECASAADDRLLRAALRRSGQSLSSVLARTDALIGANRQTVRLIADRLCQGPQTHHSLRALLDGADPAGLPRVRSWGCR